MSSGVARNTTECSQVNVSEEVTGLPSRWLADAAQRVAENSFSLFLPPNSPSGKSQ